MDVCGFAECTEHNRDTHMVTRDHFGYHWFCEEHWKFVTWLFNQLVSECTRNNGCVRNHTADFYATSKKYETVKYGDKHWNLCDTHLGTYDELLGIAIMPDFED